MTPRREILWRIKILHVFVLLLAVAIIGKLFYLHFTVKESTIETSHVNIMKEFVVQPNRGDICAHDGRILATSVPYYEIAMDPNSDGINPEKFKNNIDSLCICLAQMFPAKSKDRYYIEITERRDKGARYYRIAQRANFEQVKAIKTFPILRDGRISGGLLIEEFHERELPFGMLAKRTIGKFETDKQKGFGLEIAYDSILKGIEGRTLKRRIAGRHWMPIKDGNEVEPQDGYDLITTIDINIQDIAETALEKKLKTYKAHHGCAIVMEVNTGKIKAIANLTRHTDENYYEMYNYAVGEARDPGSTFKLASMIVTLEDGKVKPTDTIDTGNGEIIFHGKKMRDTKVGGYGKLSVQEVFEVSSNVGISKMIYTNFNFRKDDFVDGLYKLHLHEPLGVEIPGEAIPTIRRPNEGWSKISLTQMSIGYELLITPLQTLAFYNAIANNGRLVKPRFVESINYRGEIIKKFETEVIDKEICSKSTVKTVQEMLEGVVLRGTATNIKNNNYTIAGKTGTAQSEYGTGKDIQYQASFAGYFPAENPLYSCIVVIYEPDKSIGYYAGTVAAPVFLEIADRVYASEMEYNAKLNINYDTIIPPAKTGYKTDIAKVYTWLGVASSKDYIPDDQIAKPMVENNKLNYYQRNFSNKNHIPDVRGMGLRDAIVILEEFGLKVNAQGRGKVIRQEPLPNQNFRKGQTINLILG
ncbi:MAG: transpeptidase family protein [Bacteroidales bacterium]|nr:transpeptidase family protein [Bacteroidales bacterium]